jgi:hypothetical protein
MPKSFLELVPHSDYVDFSGARHMVAGDRNDHFSAAVLYFIDLKFRPLGEYLCRAHNAPMDLHFCPSPCHYLHRGNLFFGRDILVLEDDLAHAQRPQKAKNDIQVSKPTMQA